MWINRAYYEDLLIKLAEAQTEARHSHKQAEYLHIKLDDAHDALMAERARTDKATDQLLLRNGAAGIAPPEKPEPMKDDMFEEDPGILAELHAAIRARGADTVLFEDLGGEG